jgi:hypothetical protein
MPFTVQTTEQGTCEYLKYSPLLFSHVKSADQLKNYITTKVNYNSQCMMIRNVRSFFSMKSLEMKTNRPISLHTTANYI